MGLDLMDNFKQPYLSRSIAEFWWRWHISLSTWFRDYLYVPLGGNRRGRQRWYFNIMVVFLVSGLWHGANWTFLAWGGLHGFYLLFSSWTANIRERVENAVGLRQRPMLIAGVQVMSTFHLVVVSWIFFRASSLSDATYIVSHLFSRITLTGSGTGVGAYELLIAVVAILLVELVHVLQRAGGVRQMLSDTPIWFRWAAYYGLVFSILIFGKFGVTEFIYFQF